MILKEEDVVLSNELSEIKLAEQLDKHIKKLSRSAKAIENMKENATFDEVNLLAESNAINDICTSFLINRGKSKLVYDFLEEKTGVIALKENSGYKFIFDDLFPQRGNIINKTILANYTRTITYGYKKALQREIEKVAKGAKFSERVVIEIKHFFADEREVKDYDNVESKPMIDVIAFNMLKDDSPKYMSLVFDYEISSNAHTEILIMPEVDYYKRKTEKEIAF